MKNRGEESERKKVFIKKQNYVARKKNNNYSMYATPYRKNKDD